MSHNKPVAAVNSTPKKDPPSAERDTEDPYLWLEETDSAKALDWVKARNAEAVKAYAATPAFDAMRDQILEVMDSDARIPYVGKQGEFYYNFWRDKAHPLGLWRRTTLAEYRKDHPKWEVLIDLDALAKAENEKWVWHGADCLRPEYRHCLISLSRGGADAERGARVRSEDQDLRQGWLHSARGEERRSAGSTQTAFMSAPISAPAR